MGDEATFTIHFEVAIRNADRRGVLVRETNGLGQVTEWGPMPPGLVDAFLDDRHRLLKEMIREQMRRLWVAERW